MTRIKFWKTMLLLPFLAMVIPTMLIGMIMAFPGYIVFAIFSFFIIDKLSIKNAKAYIIFSPIIAGIFQIFSLLHPLLYVGDQPIDWQHNIVFILILMAATVLFGYIHLFFAAIIYAVFESQNKFNDCRV